MIHQYGMFSEECCEFISIVSGAGLLDCFMVEFFLCMLASLQMLSACYV